MVSWKKLLKTYADSNFNPQQLTISRITIPESVTSIGKNAFSGCTGLTTINYTGTEEQWNAINKGLYWNSGASFNVIYNYKPE